MTRWIGLSAVIAGLLGAGLIGIGIGQAAPTVAAWSSQSSASAALAAGTWKTANGDSCIAYGWDGGELPGCELSQIRHETWGPAGSRSRNYYLTFETPSGATSVSFDIDLGSVADDSGWSWDNAGIVPGSQLTTTSEWTCDALPRLHARGGDWQLPTVYFQVVEDRDLASTVCS